MNEIMNIRHEDLSEKRVLSRCNLGQYTLVARFCRGKRVLDIACGDGYGSAFLADNGAKSVLGLDGAADAIAEARKLFVRQSLAFVQADTAEVTGGSLDLAAFDVIIWLAKTSGTLPGDQLLRRLAHYAALGGTVILSYPTPQVEHDDSRDSVQLAQLFKFSDFQDITQNHLGGASQWMLVTPQTGLSLIETIGSSAQTACSQTTQQTTGLPVQLKSSPWLHDDRIRDRSDNCSFYLGVWSCNSPSQAEDASAIHNTHLDLWLDAITARKECQEAAQKIERLQAHIKALECRATTIRRILNFEFEERLANQLQLAINERTQANAAMHGNEQDMKHYRALKALHTTSRAHRLAALYIRSAENRPNLPSKMLHFIAAAVPSLCRAMRRRMAR